MVDDTQQTPAADANTSPGDVPQTNATQPTAQDSADAGPVTPLAAPVTTPVSENTSAAPIEQSAAPVTVDWTRPNVKAEIERLGRDADNFADRLLDLVEPMEQAAAQRVKDAARALRSAIAGV